MLRQRQLIKKNPIAFPAIRREMIPATVPSACAESSSRERFQHRRWSAYAARCGGRGRPSDRPDTRPARQPRSCKRSMATSAASGHRCASISLPFVPAVTVRDQDTCRCPESHMNTACRGVRSKTDWIVAAAAVAYDATRAAAAYRERRRRCVRHRKRVEGTALFEHVHNRLRYWRWSPQQIARRLARMHADDPQWRVSHETIYAAIYAHPRGALKQSLIEALRQSKPARGRRCRTLAKGNTVLRTCGSCLAPRTSPRARSRATGKAPSQGCMRSHRNRARAMPPVCAATPKPSAAGSARSTTKTGGESPLA